MSRIRDATDDHALIARILGGETQLFARLLDRFEPLVAATLGRLVPEAHAQDVAQEVFLALYDSLGGVDARDGLHGFVKTLCVRRAHDFWRKAANRETPLSQCAENDAQWLEGRDTAWASGSVDDLAERVAQRDLIGKLLARFSATDRLLVVLVWLEEHTVAEAARQLDISVANAKIRMFRCRRRLRSVLDRLTGEAP